MKALGKTTKTHEKHMKMDKMFNISVRCIFYTRVTQARYMVTLMYMSGWK